MIDCAIMKAAKKLEKKFHMPSDIIFALHQLYNTVKPIPIKETPFDCRHFKTVLKLFMCSVFCDYVECPIVRYSLHIQ